MAGSPAHPTQAIPASPRQPRWMPFQLPTHFTGPTQGLFYCLWRKPVQFGKFLGWPRLQTCAPSGPFSKQSNQGGPVTTLTTTN